MRRPAVPEQALELGFDVERLLAARRLPVGLRLEQLAQLVGLRRRRSARRRSRVIPRSWSDSNSTESPPLPIERKALPALAMNAIAASGIAIATTITITSPFETASGIRMCISVTATA